MYLIFNMIILLYYFTCQFLVKSEREKTKVVSYRVPHNASVQIYDYKEKQARYIYI